MPENMSLVLLMGVIGAQCANVIALKTLVSKVYCLKSVFQGIGTGSTSNIQFKQSEVPVPFTSYTHISVYV